MTPEERAEARYYAARTECGYKLAPRLIQAIDAIEAAERERDEATSRLRKHCLDESCCDGSDVVPDLIAERDTARARLAEVERERDELRKSGEQARALIQTTLKPIEGMIEALKWYERHSMGDHGDRARAALKAAGVET